MATAFTGVRELRAAFRGAVNKEFWPAGARSSLEGRVEGGIAPRSTAAYSSASRSASQEMFTVLKMYDEESIYGPKHSDEFNLTFVADARGRVYYHVSRTEDSHPGKMNYIPMGKTRERLQAVDIERLLTEIVQEYLLEPQISPQEVRSQNSELYDKLKQELIPLK
ncbi:MAG: hypothetical protein AABX13_01050 [Nanoarchaeota archaeon]